MAMVRVVAVVVTYHPDKEILARQFERLRLQVAHIVQVDNTAASEATALPAQDGHTVLRMGVNAGIGHAQNIGIAHARMLCATHVLLMDQDSLPPIDMVPLQLQMLANDDANQVAAIGPVCRDVKTGRVMSLIQRQGWRIRRVVPRENDGTPLSVAYMPASGSLIPMAMLDRVGPMRGDYFIDRVDVEWCLRAGRLGLLVWIDTRLEMEHDQGIRPVEVLGRTVFIGHGFRNYFHVRNSLAMALRSRIPLFWRIDQLVKMPVYVVFYLASADHNRWHMARLLLAAITDGLRGRMGRGHYDQRPLL